MTVSMRVGVLVAVVGCSASHVASPSPPQGEAPPVRPRARPCPADLADRISAAQPDRDDTDEVHLPAIIQCVAGSFPRPGWVAATRSRRAQEGDPTIGLVIVDDTRVVATSTTAMALGPIETGDLDGDGVDEVIVATSAAAMFGDETHEVDNVTVLALRDDALTELSDAALGFIEIKANGAMEALYACTGKRTLAPVARGVHLVVTYDAEVGRRDGRTCPAPGRHAYRLAGDRLVEVR